MERVYNFSAGPSMLPLEVLEKAGSEITSYKGSGQSVMEMSHRSKIYLEIFEETKADFKRLFKVPDNYEILFLQGGATLQFAMTAMNLMPRTGKADYAVTGSFSDKAMKEAKKYGEVNIAASSADANHTYIPQQGELKLDPGASYFYYCDNNTVYGTEWNYVPEVGDVPLVCDMSSNIMSRPVDVSKYGIIIAGAQKNLAPAGVTVAIVRNDLPGHAFPYTPIMLDYAAMIKGDSMHNTPPCYSIYVLGLVLKWVDKLGGVPAMQERREERSKLLYDYLDESKLFKGCARPDSRSRMNVTFVTGDPDLDKEFVAEAAKQGFVNISGHRSVGGMRASIYNAMPMEGVKKLVDFMAAFEKAHK
ncbi:MAG: 3-phosphoserine/phosphohydroxythreonine transaminase [Oscillospiraceae bacterium]|jgi:phosphoserine aminotransferase|nr:3-phosphoserine/phosphohydroxythreonine transaminase [Oscillospiraceae bacterium]